MTQGQCKIALQTPVPQIHAILTTGVQDNATENNPGSFKQKRNLVTEFWEAHRYQQKCEGLGLREWVKTKGD